MKFGYHLRVVRFHLSTLLSPLQALCYSHLAGEQAEVFGDDGDEELEDEALGAGAVFAAGDDLAEDIGDDVGGLAGDFDAVVAEDGFLRMREEEIERRAALREIAQEEALDGSKSWVLKS